MEQKCVLDFEDKSREAAAREREDRIGKVSKDDIERTVVDEICRCPKYSARQIASKLGVTPSSVREIRIRFAAEIERRTGVKLRLQPGDADGLYPEAPERMDMMDALTDGYKAAEAAAPNTGFVLVPEPGKEGGETDKSTACADTVPGGKAMEKTDLRTAYTFVGIAEPEDPVTVEEGNPIADDEPAGPVCVPMSDRERHLGILYQMNELYARKNHDYGNAFHEAYEEFGFMSLLIRLGDKYRRLKSLAGKDAQVTDESIRDTLMDAANYCVMGIMELTEVESKIGRGRPSRMLDNFEAVCDRMNENAKKYYRQMKEEHRCVRCWKALPEGDARVVCPACRAKQEAKRKRG